jgi:hypothetical protein
MTANQIFRMIDGPALREQRRVILRFLGEAEDPLASRVYTAEEDDVLEGLLNLLDAIADCCHDIYSKDCLFDDLNSNGIKGELK